MASARLSPLSEGDAILAAQAPDVSAAALASIVAVQGSTYRRPGARSVVPAEGPVGCISGGCLQAEVIQTASKVLSSGKPKVIRLDLSADDPPWG